MRVALITPGFSAREDDWCIPAVLDLVRELAPTCELQVFALRYPYQRRTYAVHGATVHASGGARAAGLGRLPLLARSLGRILREGRRRRFDLLHALWADEPGFLAAVAGRLLTSPALVSVMGGELVALPDIRYGGQLSPVNRGMVRIALRQASAVTVGSRYLERLATSHAPRDLLRVVPLGVDLARFHPVASPDRGPGPDTPLAAGAPRLLHVASLVPVKDQQTLLRALARARRQEPGAHLHVVGEGPLRGALVRQAEALGVASHVTFHGAVRHEQLPAFYRAADLCVLSSRHESQGMVVLEAAACGRATVGTAVGILPDLVPPCRAVPVGDASALAEAIVQWGADGGQRARAGAAARLRVESRYSLERTAGCLRDLYARLAASR